MNDMALLALTRRIGETLATTAAANAGRDYTWRWAEGIVVEPELLCPWCRVPLKTKGWVWKFSQYNLRGQFKIAPGRLVRLGRPTHPHCCSITGTFCAVPNAQHAFVSLNRHYRHDGIAPWLLYFCQHKECKPDPLSGNRVSKDYMDHWFKVYDERA